jgi:Mechanosensitive ion channel, conserved TM helix
MLAQVDQILRQATNQMADHVANFLPGLLVSLTLMLAAFLVALFARMLLVRALRGLEFDRRAEQWGLSARAGWPASTSPSQTMARVVYWTILILGLLVSLTALNATIPSRLALSVFEYVPHLLAALLILIVGTVAARFLARSVLIGAVNMQIQSARLLSLAVKWLVLLIAVAMALDHLGIGRTVLLLAFAILFGGVVLAAALAVGLGARDVVSRTLEQQLREPPTVDSKVNHV